MPVRSFKRFLRGVAGAFSFLTILPIGRAVELDRDDIARGAWCFPLVGGLVGALCAWTAWLLAHQVPVAVAAALAVALEVGLTGAMHVDALADTTDAIGGWGRERALEIMKGHTIGAFGASAIVLDLIVKVACLSSLLVTGGLPIVAAAFALGRATPAPLGRSLPYARAGEGSGSISTDRTSLASAVVSALVGIAVAVACLGVDALAPLAAVVVLVLILRWWFKRWLGGVTGDTLGATVELCSTLAIVVALAAR